MILIDGQEVQLNKFYDGTFHLKLKRYVNEPLTITWKYKSEEELTALQMIVMELHDMGIRNITLDIPYMPNARMDRVEDDPNSNVRTVFTMKHFATILKSLNFTRILTVDAHSKYTEDALAGLVVVSYPTHKVSNLIRVLQNENDFVLFFPDKGAYTRYTEKMKDIALPNGKEIKFAYGNKTRNWETSEITGYEIEGNVQPGDSILIVDDICSRGGTFSHAVSEIKKVTGDNVTINLLVSHCEENIVNGNLLKGEVNNVFAFDTLEAKVAGVNYI